MLLASWRGVGLVLRGRGGAVQRWGVLPVMQVLSAMVTSVGALLASLALVAALPACDESPSPNVKPQPYTPSVAPPVPSPPTTPTDTIEPPQPSSQKPPEPQLLFPQWERKRALDGGPWNDCEPGDPRCCQPGDPLCTAGGGDGWRVRRAR